MTEILIALAHVIPAQTIQNFNIDATVKSPVLHYFFLYILKQKKMPVFICIKCNNMLNCYKDSGKKKKYDKKLINLKKTTTKKHKTES